jgi:hypothetical protein
VGFFASTSNNFGILDHNNSSYYRNDSSWVNYAVDGTGQWTRNTAKVVGTSATYARVGETSGSSTASITNSGLNSEYVRISARYDNSPVNQDFSANWDWIIVRKAATYEPTVSLSTEEQSENPAAYWTFDEGSGTTINDSSGNKYHGTMSSATWQSADSCISNKCLVFDGNSSGVDTLHDFSWSSTDPYTISVWVRPTTTTEDHAILGKTSYEYTLMQDDNRFRFTYWSNGGGGITSLQSSTIITAGNWYYISVVSDGTTAKMYIDGKLESTDSNIAGTNQNRTESLKIGYGYTNNGSGAGTHYFSGSIDEVKIYPYARSSSQIQVGYNSRGSGSSSVVLGAHDQSALSNGLVGYWKMDEATGTSVTDSSGNGLTGTLNGSTSWITGKFGSAGSTDNSNSDRMLISAAPNLTSEWTTSVWFQYPLASTGGSWWTLFRGGGAVGQDHQVIVSRSSYLLGMYDNTTSSGFNSTGFAMNTLTNGWHHMATVGSGTSQKFYIDGKYVGQTDKKSTSGIYSVGNCSCDGQSWGTFDEVRVYNRALSPTEVTQLYGFAPGPVAYYNMEEGLGSVLKDISTHGNNGSLIGGTPDWLRGKYGRAISFDNGEYANLGSPLHSPASWTYSVWIYPTAGSVSSADGIIGQGNNPRITWGPSVANDRRIGVLAAWSESPGYKVVTSPSQLELNKWHYITAVFDTSDPTNQTIKLYINGILVGSNTATTGTLTKPSSTHYINVRDSAKSFPGSIDELKIYDYARTQGQIVQDMNAGHPLGGSPVASQVSYYKFDEGYGTTIHNEGHGGSILNGTISGATWSNDGKFGKALHFDGSSSNVNIADNAALDLTSSWTIGGWFNPDETILTGSDRQVLISKWQTSSGTLINYYLYIRANGKVETTVSDGSSSKSVTSTTVLSPHTWYHLMGTFDGSTGDLKIYINSKLEATTATGYSSAYANTGSVRLGQYDFGWGAYRDEYKGLMDEIKIYSAALSASEIKVDYNNNAALALGSTSISSGNVASNSASSAHCIPGDTSTCTPPVGEWNLNEGKATTANDISGNGYSGTLINNPSWTQGKIGNAIKFDGTNDYIGTSSDIDYGAGNSITVSAWVKYSSCSGNAGYCYIVAKNQTIGSAPYNLGIYPTNKLAFSVNGASVASTNTYADNQWHYVVGTLSGTSATLFVDGQFQAKSTVTPINNNEYVTIGGDDSSDTYRPFSGSIDQVSIYDYARTSSQIAWDYNQGKPIASYDFDECSGSTLHDLMFGNNGTITIGASGTQTSVGTCQTPSTAWGNGVTGKFNNSLNFDGVDDWIDGVTQPSFQASPNLFSVSGWIKPGAQDGFLITPNSNGIDQWIGYDTDLQRLWVSVATASDTNQVSYYSSNYSVPTNSWTNFIVTINDRTVNIFINGILNKQVTHGFDIGGWTGNWRIGQRGNSTNWYLGQLDDLKIFNYALTKQQVQTIFNQGSSVRFGP